MLESSTNIAEVRASSTNIAEVHMIVAQYNSQNNMLYALKYYIVHLRIICFTSTDIMMYKKCTRI